MAVSITLEDGLMVKAGWSEDECDSSAPFSTVLREDACKHRRVARIQTCSHPDASFLSITADSHLQAPCQYCGMSFGEEPHRLDGTDIHCAVCGYEYNEQLVSIHFEADGGAGVHVGSGSFRMEGGAVSGNTVSARALNGGGGVGVDSGTFILTGGTISGNTASQNGGMYVAVRSAWREARSRTTPPRSAGRLHRQIR